MLKSIDTESCAADEVQRRQLREKITAGKKRQCTDRGTQSWSQGYAPQVGFSHISRCGVDDWSTHVTGHGLRI